jgi:hypothetical protein
LPVIRIDVVTVFAFQVQFNFNTINQRFILFDSYYTSLRCFIFYFVSCILHTHLSQFLLSGQLESPVSPNNRSSAVCFH